QTDHHLPCHCGRSHYEHHVTECAYPAQCLQQALLHELLTARIPHAFRHTRIELDQPYRQQTGGNHQHQASIQAPESVAHQLVIKTEVLNDVTQHKQNKTDCLETIHPE